MVNVTLLITILVLEALAATADSKFWIVIICFSCVECWRQSPRKSKVCTGLWFSIFPKHAGQILPSHLKRTILESRNFESGSCGFAWLEWDADFESGSGSGPYSDWLNLIEPDSKAAPDSKGENLTKIFYLWEWPIWDENSLKIKQKSYKF